MRSKPSRCQRALDAEPLVELMHFGGEENLRFRPFKVDVGVIRGSDIDERGNLSTEREAANIDVTGVAMVFRPAVSQKLMSMAACHFGEH